MLSRSPPPEHELRYAEPGRSGSRIISTEAPFDPGSLELTADEIRWTSGGEARSAPAVR